ncbi:MAG: DUF4276 family protein [Desulfosarcina sp.]|nr:DUF4276 family protein [Desulfosarcina sp.]MBC2742788.1 DUF4276 family protein [Desulfosarcina sp.]MBC2765698.1 DUF4276 family protein [Desulfosarcina sp.]
MARMLVHVEGETEEAFVNEVLRSHLARKGYTTVSARIVGNARQRVRRGGIRAWSAVRRDIVNHLREDSGCMATTMVDYYALPQTGARAWPGRETAGALSFAQKAVTVESGLAEDICREMGGGFNPARFVPFVMMHEFEGMLFSDCERFGQGIGRPDLSAAFQAIRDEFATPEEINDSPVTAPSKRVLQLMPGYEKPLLGPLAALEIGLNTIRRECPHFREWLTRLEGWPHNRN